MAYIDVKEFLTIIRTRQQEIVKSFKEEECNSWADSKGEHWVIGYVPIIGTVKVCVQGNSINVEKRCATSFDKGLVVNW